MSNLKRALLLIFLTPLFFILLISSLNYNKRTNIKILTWTSPQANLGLLMGLSACTGSLFAFTSLYSLFYSPIKLKRTTKTTVSGVNYNQESSSYERFSNCDYTNSDVAIDITQFPERKANEPKPTLSVPYRIIKSKQAILLGR